MFLAPNGTTRSRAASRSTPNQAVAIAKTAPKMIAIHRTHHPLQIVPYVWVASHYEIYFYYHGQGHRGPARRSADGQIEADVHRAADPRHLRPRPLRPDLRLAAGARAVHADVPAPAAAAPRPVVVRPVRHRCGADVRRVLRAVRQRPPRGGGVDVLSAAHLPARPDADPRLQAAPRRRHGSTAACPRPCSHSAWSRWWSRGSCQRSTRPASSTSATASALGAYKLLHGQSLYYFSLGHGDTYGPIAYLAYAPFELLFPGSWQYLPAARAAAITFDLLTIAGLIVLGWRLRVGGATGGASDCCWRGSGLRARAPCSAWRRAPTTGWWR